MKRPFSVTLLVILLLFTAISNGLRLFQAIFFWKILLEYNASSSYIAISGGFWLLVAGFLVMGIWLRRTWAWAGTISGAAGYGLWFWFDRLVVQFPHANWPFALVITLLLAGIFALILFNPKTRLYFKTKETRYG